MTTHDSTLNNPGIPQGTPDPTTIQQQQPRYRPVGKRVAIRAIGFSESDEAKLKQLTALLSDGTGDGAPSVSLVVRKSLEVYLLKILGMKNDPSTLAHEVSALHVKAKRLCRGRRRQSHHKQS
jgi:hypothetical protein